MNCTVLIVLLMTTIATYAHTRTGGDSTGVASNRPVRAHAHYDGIISMSTNGKYGFFCLGGPSVGISQGHWRVAINMYPSLRIGRPEGSLAPQITPTLGTGVYVAYKRAILLVPFHYITEDRAWTTAIGLGWRVTN